VNSFTATATDAFSHTSNAVSAQFTVDTIAPAFLNLTPADGFLTRQAAQTISGTLSEAALVTINGDPVLTDSNNAFSRSVTLTEGKNTFTIVAQDGAGNVAQRVLNLFLDTIPPTPANAGLVAFSAVNNGEVTLSGAAGSVESGATVTVNNLRSLGVVSVLADAGGSFTLVIGAQAGDRLSLVVSDQAGNNSAAIELLVPGDTGDELPPDPATVAPALDRTVANTLFDATSFLYSGPNPIQTGVAEGTIEARRVAVLRGTVTTRDGEPLSGVKVTVLNHLEFGQTLTRTDGMFDLAVNGGGTLTLEYGKENFLPVQRTLPTPWRDYVIAPDVVMVPLDPQVTTVDLTAPVIQVARGSTSTDEDGTRQATLLFAPGTTANMVLPNGTTQPLTTMNVRATEYTVGPNGPQTMPAELPPTSGYTYAVELSVDEAIAVGAKTVQFNQPVYHYVENFLNFPVGQNVPVGFYDRDKAAWIPSDNGRVIKILGTAGGIATLDTNGDGLADDATQLTALNITDAERSQLASLYAPNSNLWRVPISHFTPWDYNWPYGPPDDATDPKQPEPVHDNQEDDPCTQSGSIIECQNQVLGQRIPIVGTPFSLNYRSSRVLGRNAAYSTNISLSGATVPASLRGIVLRIEVAGRRFTKTFPAAPNQSHVFTWDGLDAYGRQANGPQLVSISVGYVYELVYQRAAGFARSFNRISGIPTSANRGSRIITLYQNWQRTIGTWDARGQGLGGWSISAQHHYDPVGQTLYLGDGDRQSAEGDLSTVITTVAGGGINTNDGGPATQARLRFPRGVAEAPDGSLFISDTNNQRVRRISPDGVITTIAGTGAAGFGGDGGPATQARLGDPQGVVVAPDGSVYFTDTANRRVRRISSDGIITSVAGGGISLGDGGLATQASLIFPTGLALAPDGSLYIVDAGIGRVRRISPDGIIITVAGGGVTIGDRGPASQASLHTPTDVAISRDGSLYIAESSGHRIRRVAPDGIITTVAGTGSAGFSGDGGLATQSTASAPRGVTVALDGSVYFTEEFNQRVRRVSPDGIITTVAGSGVSGFSGDGGPGTQARVNRPAGILIAQDGDLYVADSFNSRIRRLSTALPQFSLGDIAISSNDGQRLGIFDSGGRHRRTISTRTGATVHSFSYTPEGFLSSITDGDGNVTAIERGTNGDPLALVAPDGQRTTLALDPNGYLAAVTNPAGESHTLTYTAEGLLASFTNPRGHASRFTYDADGRLIKDENAAAGFLSLSRTVLPDGYAVEERSALDRTRTYRVDKLPTGDRQWVNTGPDGTQIQTVFRTNGARATTAPDGTVTTTVDGPDPRFGMQAPITKSLTTKLPSGLTAQLSSTRSVSLLDPNDRLSLATQTDTVTVNGKTATKVYNAAAREHTLTTAAGHVVRTATDLQGRPTQFTVGGLAPVNYAYDVRGRLTTVSQGGGVDTRNMSFAYDAQGNIASITDPANRTQSFTYDPAGRLTAQTLPDGREIRYAYDANGNVTNITPPGRPAHGFQYTAVDLEEQYTPPALAGIANPATRYAYNLDRELTSIIRPDGQTVTLGYDAAGRLARLAPSVAIGGATINYAYHPTQGFLESITTTDAETLTYTNDGFLVTGETWSGSIAGQVTRAYNSDFQISALSVNGASIPFGYDPDGLLSQAGALGLTRDVQHGLLTATTLGSVTTTQDYNVFGELGQFSASIASAGSYEVQFTRDALGRIAQKSETLPGELASTFTYGYDLVGRLTTVTKDGVPVAQYAYDANGNRLSKTTPTGTVTATYDDQDRLLTYGNNTYTYTANGELKSKAVSGQQSEISYDYDVFGNLRHVTLPDGTSIDYVLDGRNRRIGKKVNGALVQGFLYQDQLNPIAEFDGSGNIISRFVYASRPNVPDYLIKNGQTYRIISDQLGSPRLVIHTQTGVVEQRLDYDEFGNITFDSNPGFQPFGFAGGLYDRDTKLTRFGARDYDAETGRWTSKDPIKFKGRSTNLYGYVLNDPVNWIDLGGYIQVKPGANIKNLSPEMRATFPVIDSYIQSNTPFSEGIITSGNDSKHKKGSLHYQDNAIDIRGNNVPDEVMSRIVEDIAWELGPDYDVIPEFYPNDPLNDHIHIEYDPKGPKGKRPKSNCP
jgi:RHS repeat-associated protein